MKCSTKKVGNLKVLESIISVLLLSTSIYFIIEMIYSMPQTVWNTENLSKWTSNVQLLCSTASTNWIIYSWLTSNPKISIWVHTRAKIHSFLKCATSIRSRTLGPLYMGRLYLRSLYFRLAHSRSQREFPFGIDYASSLSLQAAETSTSKLCL